MQLKIGELAQRTGLTTRTLRHYDELGLLTPGERTEADYRLYSEGDLYRLLHIQGLKSLGLSLEEIRQALDHPEFQPQEVIERHIALIEERQAEYTRLLARLRNLREAAAVGWEEMAEVIALSERLHHPSRNQRTLAALSVTPADTAALSELVERLGTEPDFSVREHLTWAVVQLGEQALPVLQAQLNHTAPEVRLQVVHALTKLADPRTIPLLVSLLADSELPIIRKALFALGQLRSPEAAAALISQLGHPDLETATVLSEALQAQGELALPALHEALTQPEAAVRTQAAEALGRLGDPRSGDSLIEALEDSDEGVQFSALFALSSLKGEEVNTAIAGLTDHPRPRLRILARRLLEDRGAAS